MPARKTTAAERERAMNRRKNLAVLAIGAIPVLVLVILGGVFLYNRATELGADEMPSSIGEGERAEIRKTIDDFYGFVNQYNPQFISSTMLSVPELGDEEFSRLIMEVAPLESEALKFTVLTLGSTALAEDGKYVQARVATNFGNREFRLARRDGQWKVAAVPDLLVPQEAGPMRVEWSVAHSFVIDPGQLPSEQAQPSPTVAATTPAATGTGAASGTPRPQGTPPPQKTLYVVGRVRNLSSEPGYMLSASGFVSDGAGRTLATARPPMPANPYISPGEEAYFQIQFKFPDEGNLDASNFVLVPDFRQVGRTDEATFVSDQVLPRPASVPWRPQTEITTVVTNGDTREVTAQVFAYFLDGSGAPQFITPVTPQLKLAPGYVLTVPLPIRELPDVLSATQAIEFRVFATPPRPAAR